MASKTANHVLVFYTDGTVDLYADIAVDHVATEPSDSPPDEQGSVRYASMVLPEAKRHVHVQVPR